MIKKTLLIPILFLLYCSKPFAMSEAAQLAKLLQAAQQQIKMLKEQLEVGKYISEDMKDSLETLRYIKEEYDYISNFDLRYELEKIELDLINSQLLYDVNKLKSAQDKLDAILSILRVGGSTKEQSQAVIDELKKLINQIKSEAVISDTYRKNSTATSNKEKDLQKITASATAYLASQESSRRVDNLNQRIENLEKLSNTVETDIKIMNSFNHRGK